MKNILNIITLSCALLFFPFVSQAACVPEAQVNKTVKLTTLDWAPYIGESLPGKGYVYKIIDEAFKCKGYVVDVKFLGWNAAVNWAKEGRAAGVFPDYYDETLIGDDFSFSADFQGGPVGLMSFEAQPPAPGAVAADLGSDKVGLVTGYINTPEVDGLPKQNKDSGAGSDEINMIKLMSGKVKYIFIDKFVAKDTLNALRDKGHPAAKKVEGKDYMFTEHEVKPLFIRYSNKYADHADVKAAFEAGLAEIKENGTLDRIIKEDTTMQSYQ